MLRSSRLGKLLVSSRTITEEQLNAALQLQKARGCRLGEVLIELGYCSEVEVTRAFAEQMELPFVDLKLTPPEPQVVRLLPREVAVKLGVVPVRIERERLLVAAANPLDISIDEKLRSTVRMQVTVCAAPPSQLADALAHYEQLKRVASPPGAASGTTFAASGLAPAGASGFTPGSISLGGSGRTEAQGMQRLQALVAEALRKGVRDLYFQPQREGLEVRGDIDGAMQSLAQLAPPESASVETTLRVLAGVAALREAVTSSCELRIEGAVQQLSIRSLPVAEGMVFVLRARREAEAQPPLDALGMEDALLQSIRRLLAQRSGLLLVAGPMDSGRSTTLTAMVRDVSSPSARVMTVEEAVDTRIPGAMQVQVDSRRADAAGLRTEVLNHRPDVLLIEGLGDRPTAEIACRAATNGTLVLAGSHAPHALRALARFTDLGVAPYTTATALSGILAQRLVRRVCPDCSTAAVLPPALEESLTAAFGSLAGLDFRRGQGCERCHGLGTRGRIGIFEWIEIDEDLRRLITERVMPSVLQEHLRKQGHQPLAHDAFLKAGRGLVPYEGLQNLLPGVADGLRPLH